MAGRIAKTSINWASLAERVPPKQMPNFAAFKAKSDNYLRAVLANPEKPPKIDWEHYKRLIPEKSLVDTFQKQYESLKIPFPPDTVSAQIDEQAKSTKAEIDTFKCASQERIVKYQKDIDHLNSMLPYDQMTMEDFRDAHPEIALDPINRPTFWPHTPDEQLGYKSKEQQAAEH